jgi:hypothetical protein
MSGLGLGLRVNALRHGGAAPMDAGISRASSGGLYIWLQPDDGKCVRALLSSPDATQRMSWRRTDFANLRSVYTVGEMTSSGAWGQLHTSGGAYSGSYVGNRARNTVDAGAYLETSVSRVHSKKYDLWVAYTKRTAGAFCRVDIDGSQDLVNEISDPSGLGFKAFSTAGPVDLVRMQWIKVASGLTGEHSVRVAHGGSDAGVNLIIEAVGITADISDPRINPPEWLPSTSYTIGDEVQHGGVYYACRATGTSGVVGPTHLSGIGSDGLMDWRADYKTTYQRWVTVDYISEREYAVRIKKTATAEVGGQTHLNDTLLSRSIFADGVPWSESSPFSAITVAKKITLQESTIWGHPDDATLAECVLYRTVGSASISHRAEVQFTTDGAEMGWSYPAMMPFVSYDGELAERCFTEITPLGYPVIDLDSYDGASNPNVTIGPVYSCSVSGVIDGSPIEYRCTVSPESVNSYEDGAFFVRPNVSGGTTSGPADWTAKNYFARQVVGAEIFSGDEFVVFESTHQFK